MTLHESPSLPGPPILDQMTPQAPWKSDVLLNIALEKGVSSLGVFVWLGQEEVFLTSFHSPSPSRVFHIQWVLGKGLLADSHELHMPGKA